MNQCSGGINSGFPFSEVAFLAFVPRNFISSSELQLTLIHSMTSYAVAILYSNPVFADAHHSSNETGTLDPERVV